MGVPVDYSESRGLREETKCRGSRRLGVSFSWTWKCEHVRSLAATKEMRQAWPCRIASRRQKAAVAELGPRSHTMQIPLFIILAAAEAEA